MRAKKADNTYIGNEVIRMSHSVRFDTLAYANRLKSAGVPDKQAEAQSGALAEIFDEQSASKKDLQETEARLMAAMDSKISEVNIKVTAIDNKIADIKVDLTRWAIGLIFIQSAALVSLLKLFH